MTKKKPPKTTEHDLDKTPAQGTAVAPPAPEPAPAPEEPTITIPSPPETPPIPPGAAGYSRGFGFIKEANVTSEDISVRDASIGADKSTPPDHLSIASLAQAAKMHWVYKVNPVRWAAYDRVQTGPLSKPAKHRGRIIPDKLHSPTSFAASFRRDYTYTSSDQAVHHDHQWMHKEFKTLAEAFEWLESQNDENTATAVAPVLQT